MRRQLLACACIGVFALGGAGAAFAGDDDGGSGGSGGGTDVIRALDCSGVGVGKLKLGREDGRQVEAEFELQRVGARQRYRIRIRHNGRLVSSVVRRSSARGRIELERRYRDRAGADRISVVAQRLPRGQRCTASALAPDRDD